MPPRPKKQSSNVVVTIKYGGLKATQFFSKYTPQAYKQLLKDLKELGFPFPKKSNIVFLSHGTLEFFWPIALYEKSIFVTNLVFRITLPEPGPFKDEQTAMRRQLSMYMLQDELPFSLTVREDQYYNPYAPPQTTGPQVSQTLPMHVAPLTNRPPPEPPKHDVRYHPYSRPQAPATFNSNEGHKVSGAKSVSGALRYAETFLDQVGSTLQMAVQARSEIVEPAVHRPVQQLPPSYAKSSKLPTASQRSIPVKQENSSPKLSCLSGAPASPVVSNSAASWRTPPSPITRMSSPSADYHSRKARSTPKAVPPQNPTINGARNVAPSAPHHSPTMHPIQNISTHGPPRPNPLPDRPPPNAPTGPALTRSHPRKSNIVTTSNPHAPAPHQSLESSASHGTTLQRPAQESSMPVPTISSPAHLPAMPTPFLQQSTKELLHWVDKYGKNLASAIERQNRVVDELDQRKVPIVPPKLSLLSSDDEVANKAKLQETERNLIEEQTRYALSKSRIVKILNESRARQISVEDALESERAKRVEMENLLRDERAKWAEMEITVTDERAKRFGMEDMLRDERLKRVEIEDDLRDERTRRIEMENILKDIERERKSPFIVPALLDTFIQISQATTAAINHQASFKTDI